MASTITLSSDIETLQEFSKLSKNLKKPKSLLFREMVHFFVANKDNLSNGLRIEVA